MNNLKIPSNAWIGAAAFAECSNLKQVTLPKGISTRIYESTFSGCCSLKSISIPNNITAIDAYAFNNCESLTSVTIPDGVELGESVFSWCENLTSVQLPSDLEAIPSYAFCGCSNLTSISLPESLTSIGREAFAFCFSLKSISIPDQVSAIGPSAFASCYNLASITIPGGAKVDAGAFRYCTALQNVVLSEGASKISPYTFADCINLQRISIPRSISHIQGYAFKNCNALTQVNYGSTKTDWDAITINDGNEALCNVSLLFSLPVLEVTPDTTGAKIQLTTPDGKIYHPVSQNGQFVFEALAPGDYTLLIEKEGYTSYGSSFIFDGNSDSLPAVHLLRPGDINQSGGEADAIDIQRLYEYLTGSYTITDPYLLKVANVNGDEALDVYDLQMLYEMVSRI